MKVQIGVMGSAGGRISPGELELARRLGRRIAERDCTIVTGACPGLPHAAVLGAADAGGISLGVSPALSREEHVNVYASPLQPYTTMVFTGSGLMGRETHNIHSSDLVLFVGGRSGTLGEFCIAYDEGKLIGLVTNSGRHFERVRTNLETRSQRNRLGHHRERRSGRVSRPVPRPLFARPYFQFGRL